MGMSKPRFCEQEADYILRIAQMCFLPPCSLHAREHHMSSQRGHRGKFVPAFMHVEHIVLQESLEPVSTAARTGWSLVALVSLSTNGDGGKTGGEDTTVSLEGPPQSKVNKVRVMDGLCLEPDKGWKNKSGESGGVS